MAYRFLLFLFSTAILMVAGCGGGSNTHNDTATSGHIWIAADESLKPIIELEEQVFEATYPQANIDIIYASEKDVIALLTSDSVKVAILTRQLLADEKKHFDDKKIVPRYSPFATDAITLIRNKKATDTIFSTEQLAGILNGSAVTWNDLHPGSSNKNIQVVFDNAGSGALRQLTDSVLKGSNISKNCYALNDNKAVIEYVEKNENSIGIIGMAWISDKEDSVTHGFLNRIVVCDMIPKNPLTAEAPTMKPYQAYVALKQYPLWRTVEFVNCTGRTGLGTGFASFVASDKGQRIILKSGLVPANAPIRIVQLNSN